MIWNGSKMKHVFALWGHLSACSQLVARRRKRKMSGTALSQETLELFNFNREAFSSRIGNLWVPVFCIACWSWTSHERHLAESTQSATCNTSQLKGPVVRRPRAVPKGGKGADSRRLPKKRKICEDLVQEHQEHQTLQGNTSNFIKFRKTSVFFLSWFLDSLFPFFLGSSNSPRFHP